MTFRPDPDAREVSSALPTAGMPAKGALRSGISTDAAVTLTWRVATAPLLDPGRQERLDLREGERHVFGISSSSGAFGPGVRPYIAALEVRDSRVLISNFTANTTFVIENLEGGTELVKTRPGHLRTVIPFELSRVWIPSGMNMVELTVFGSSPQVLDNAGTSEVTEPLNFKLDPTSKYFVVLVALCEPRLRGSSMAAVPSANEVVKRLRGSDGFSGANRSSINYHIDYLADQKLPVGQWAKYEDRGRMHSKREALVAFALRFDLVTEADLCLLPSHKRESLS